MLATLPLTSVLTLSFSRYCFTQPIPWDLWEVSHALAPHQCPHPWWLLLYVRRPTRPCTQSACGTLACPCSCARGPLRLHPSVRTRGVGSLVSQDRVLHWLEFRSCCLPCQIASRSSEESRSPDYKAVLEHCFSGEPPLGALGIGIQRLGETRRLTLGMCPVIGYSKM